MLKLNINRLKDKCYYLSDIYYNNKIFNSDYELNILFNHFINENKNSFIDYELSSFTPLNVNEFVFKVKRQNNQLFYSDMGYNQQDLNTFSAALKNFKLRINFYDSDNISNRFLIYSININNQFNEYQRTPDGSIINDINLLPIIFTIKKPDISLINNMYNIGFTLPLPNKKNFVYPKTFFVSYQILNSKTGDIILLNGEQTQISNNLKYVFTNDYNYTIIENNADITTDGLKKIINLKII